MVLTKGHMNKQSHNNARDVQLEGASTAPDFALSIEYPGVSS